MFSPAFLLWLHDVLAWTFDFFLLHKYITITCSKYGTKLPVAVELNLHQPIIKPTVHEP